MRLHTMSSSALLLPLSFSTTSLTQPYQYHHHAYSSSLPNTTLHPQLDQQCTSEDFSPYQYQQNSIQKPKTIRYRLSQLCKDGELHLARQLFDEIPQPTTVVWNAMIIGYMCHNMHYEAIDLYSKMKTSCKCDSDRYTYSSILKACAETEELRIGKAVHCHILRSDIHPGRIVYNSLLNMYASCLSTIDISYDCDLVKRVFDTMPKRNVVSWNTMISWYLKTDRPVESLLQFVIMMKMGIKLSVVSFINVFPAATGMGDVMIADVLYGLVIRLGREYVDDLFVVSSAIYMYAELGYLSIARRIFEKCSVRNTEIWNSMIGGYVQDCCPIEALNLFLKALDAEDDVALDNVTFLSAITAISQLQYLEFAQQLHAYLTKMSLLSSIVISNAVIYMYSKCNKINESFRLFNAMQERDLVSWNTMISALIQNGLDDEGLMLVYELQNQGFMIDAVTVTAILSAGSNIRDQQIGKQTHAYLIRHGVHFEGMHTYLIDMYAKCDIIRAAEVVFDMNSTNNRHKSTWNAMISRYIHNGFIKQSLAVFRLMLEQKVAPTAVTLAAILPACGQSGSLALGKQFHGFIIRNFLDNNVFVISALVDMYSKTGSIPYAESVFRISSENNTVTCTNMILGYGQHGMGDKAVRLFYSWREFGFQPDGVTFLAALSACSYSGLVNEGLQIFESMNRDDGVHPSQEHYACVVDMLGRAGRLTEAYEFLEDLGEESNVLEIWGSLLAACIIHRNYDLGKVVANKVLHMAGGRKISGYHVLLSNIYAAEGDWESVHRVRSGMREKGFKKEVGCSWIGISGHTHYFASKDEKHSKSYEIYEILKQLRTNMKDAGYKPSLGCQED